MDDLFQGPIALGRGTQNAKRTDAESPVADGVAFGAAFDAALVESEEDGIPAFVIPSDDVPSGKGIDANVHLDASPENAALGADISRPDAVVTNPQRIPTDIPLGPAISEPVLEAATSVATVPTPVTGQAENAIGKTPPKVVTQVMPGAIDGRAIFANTVQTTTQSGSQSPVEPDGSGAQFLQNNLENGVQHAPVSRAISKPVENSGDTFFAIKAPVASPSPVPVSHPPATSAQLDNTIDAGANVSPRIAPPHLPASPPEQNLTRAPANLIRHLDQSKQEASTPTPADGSAPHSSAPHISGDIRNSSVDKLVSSTVTLSPSAPPSGPLDVAQMTPLLDAPEPDGKSPFPDTVNTPALRTGAWTVAPAPAPSWVPWTATPLTAVVAHRAPPAAPELGLDTLPALDFALQPVLATGSSTALATQTSILGQAPTATAQVIAQQISAALSNAPDSDAPLELALDPPELGRVRMQVTEIAGVMTLSIHAERPETADLMRRHLNLLAQEFAQAGLDAPSVHISQEGAQDRGGHRPSDSPPDHAGEPASADASTSPVPLIAPTPTGGLDLRL